MSDESAYLELKGLIIDWATTERPPFEPKEIVIMLNRIIKDFEVGKSGRLWKK